MRRMRGFGIRGRGFPSHSAVLRHLVSVHRQNAKRELSEAKRARREAEKAARIAAIERETNRLMREGWGVADKIGPALRRAGLDVISVDTKTVGGRVRKCFWARKWAVDLYLEITRLALSPRYRMAALRESARLGKPGPAAQAAIVSGMMMG